MLVALLLGVVAMWRFKLPLAQLQVAGLLFAVFASIATVAQGLQPRFAANPLSAGVSELRHSAISAATGVTGEAKALVLGLALGDTSQLAPSLKAAMQTVSLTHLTAVSGANCAIVVAAVYFALAMFSLRVRIAVSLLALIGYLMLVGPQASVLRAATMAAVILVAKASGRRITPLYAMALAISILLAITPSIATSLSFQLSVLATLGLLWLAPLLFAKFHRLPKWLAAGLSVTIAAQLFCFPLLLQLQGGIPTYSIFANLIAEPLVAPVTVIGLVAVCFAWSPIVAGALFWLASLFAAPIAVLAVWFAALPFATLPWSLNVLGVLAAITLVIAVLIWLHSGLTWLRNLAALVALAISLSTIGVVANRLVQFAAWPTPDWQVVSCDVGQGDATVVRSAGQIALIDTGRHDDLIDQCLSKLGVNRIQLLVLTHFDLDHVAGLAGAINHRQVDQAMVTSFHDDRPGADWVRTELERQGIRVLRAERGETGVLGQSTWQVLNPEHEGAGAEDSNDGSIAMLFHLQHYDLLALADLGEKGQMRLASHLNWAELQHGQPIVMKVAHHGSGDQYPEFVEAIHPVVALISVGLNNGYGHPTLRTLNLLQSLGSIIVRTDQVGSAAVGTEPEQISVSSGG
jgi:competence protein ComEC